MCEPATLMTTLQIASATAAVAQTFADIQSRNQQASFAEAAAIRAANADLNAIALQQQQLKQRFELQRIERQLQALRERATLAVAAGEAGVAGNSVLREAANIALQANRDTSIQKTNLQNQLTNTFFQAQAVRQRRDARIRQARSSRVSPFLGGLMIASRAVGAANSLGIGG